MSLVDRIYACNRFNPQNHIPFYIQNCQIGWIHKKYQSVFQKWPESFKLSENGLALSDGLDTFEARTAAFKPVIDYLRNQEIVSGWRSELYGVTEAFGQPPLLAIERAVAPFFGIRTYGTHLNGFIRHEDTIKVWIAKRAEHLAFAPGQLDNIAAGGLPMDISPVENMRKEAREEAHIPATLLKTMRQVSTISYLLESPQGVTPDTMLVYDVELPADFVPIPNPAEVAHFQLFTLTELLNTVSQTEHFKYNSALVMIDFLIRHGAISEQDPNYPEIKCCIHP